MELIIFGQNKNCIKNIKLHQNVNLTEQLLLYICSFTDMMDKARLAAATPVLR